MAEISSPLASAGFEGTTVFSPGIPAVIQYSDWECWAAACIPAPDSVRTVSGTLALPPSM